MRLELDSIAVARAMEPWLSRHPAMAMGAVLFFAVPSREDVDRVFERMTHAGYRAQKAPEDAFWDARYAIIEDPDGNAIGLTSEADDAYRRRPPTAPG